MINQIMQKFPSCRMTADFFCWKKISNIRAKKKKNFHILVLIMRKYFLNKRTFLHSSKEFLLIL